MASIETEILVVASSSVEYDSIIAWFNAWPLGGYVMESFPSGSVDYPSGSLVLTRTATRADWVV